MIAVLRSIADSNWFPRTITTVIIFAGIIVGIETYPSMVDRYGTILHLINQTILTIFIVEIIIKMGAEWPRPWNYFKDPWNVFDFLIVAAALMPIKSEYVTVLRLARLLRVLRLVRAVPRLQILVGALLKSIPSMGYVAVLLLLLFYIYAVAGTFLFSVNDPVNFGDLPKSMVALYRAITLEDWTDLMYLQMHGCLGYPYGVEKFDLQCTVENNESFPIASPLFFISFTLLGTMIFLNLMVGVILNGMDEAQAEQEQEGRENRRASGTLHIQDEIHEIQEQLEQIQKDLRRIARSH
ncbi:MAG: ion transporter [Leptospiraceae bacterium]|nr:ion transporter [Leptospiraceae bacterium]MCB1317331.1 ion transporter [Leptospiraceae bacterium]